MHCLKCNRETEDNQVFCKECLAQMAKEPIKPGTPVTIPKRPPSTPRENLPPAVRPEEQVVQLQHQVSRLHKWITVVTVLLLIVSSLLLYGIATREEGFSIGQNYTPMDPVTPHTAATLPLEK